MNKPPAFESSLWLIYWSKCTMELCFPSQNCTQNLHIMEHLIVPSCLMSWVMTSVPMHQPHSNANGIKAIISASEVAWLATSWFIGVGGEWRKKVGQQRIIFVSVSSNIGVLSKMSWPHSIILGQAPFGVCISVYTCCGFKYENNGNSSNLCSRS